MAERQNILTSTPSTELQERLDERIRAWRIVVERLVDTHTSVLALGRRDGDPVVLKIVKAGGEEWRSGDIVDAFEGKGVVRVYEHVEGAMLLERLRPGRSLLSVALSGADDEATGILAETIRSMSPRAPTIATPTVADWGKAFDDYAATGDIQVPAVLFSLARQLYSQLCTSQSAVRLLHGDLHHANVLLDDERGWLAIDPKGVIGELEYEVGAALRNPIERPALFGEPSIIGRRVDRFARELGLDAARVRSWAFAQAVLCVIWMVEDGCTVERDNGWIAMANAIRPTL